MQDLARLLVPTNCTGFRYLPPSGYGTGAMSRAQRVVVFVGIWTVLGLFFASRSILIYSLSQDEVDWILPLKLSLAEWYSWGLLAPAVLWLSRRFSLGPKAWRRNLPIHIAAGLVISMAKIVLDGFVQPLVGGYPSTLAYKLHTNLVTFWAIIAVSQAILYYRKYRDRELEATQLEAKLAQAQLNVLKSELHPHFLFNTLHGISTLMHRDVEAADRMLSRLGDLLRHSLEHLGEQKTPLREELEFLGLYLEIEKMRLGERLSVELDVAPDTLDLDVPSLVLQPLVENAIRHAIAPRVKGGRVSIRAARSNGRLTVRIEDDGPGFPGGDPFSSKTGIGLANTKARLEHLYGADHELRATNGATGGAIVVLELPVEER